MYSFHRSVLPARRQFACKFLLTVFWLTGLGLGICFAVHAGDSLILMMRSAAAAPVSITGLMAVLALPFLITALAVYLSQPRLLLVLAFVKACCFGFCASSIDTAFQSAGWLVRYLLMFSELCYLPVLTWFWMRHISGFGRTAVKDLAVCAGAAVAIGLVDYCFVSPWLAMLL